MIDNKVDRTREVDRVWVFIKLADGISHRRQVNQCWQGPAQSKCKEHITVLISLKYITLSEYTA